MPFQWTLMCEDSNLLMFFLLCLVMCESVCVSVRLFPWRSALYFFASVAFFSADNKESGNGSFLAAPTPSGALIATNNCHLK